jgi:pteridine reductase
MELQGKWALVTGAGHRLGLAIAQALGREGCYLVMHYHTAAEEASKALAHLQEAGTRALAIQADLSRADERRALFQAIDQAAAGPDLLVNSAAIMRAGDLLSVTEEDWDRTLDLNLKAAFFCLQESARRMRARGGGSIVNIADVAGLRPWARFPVHSISKSAILMLTQVACLALAPGIRVNAVAPGPVLKPEGLSTARWDEFAARLPLRHPGSPEEIAAAVVFLMKNDYITGETLVVDGGNQWV